MSEPKKIHTARVLRDGWEMDNEMWVVEDSNGCRVAVTTCHGGECPMSIDDIDATIKEAQNSIDGLNKTKV